MSEDATQLGSSAGLNVGDRVRVKFFDPLPGPFLIIELRQDDVFGSGRNGVVAVVRNTSDEQIYPVSVGRLERYPLD